MIKKYIDENTIKPIPSSRALIRKFLLLNSNEFNRLIQKVDVIKHAIEINSIFFNKKLFIKLISFTLNLSDRIKQIMRFTNPEAITIPVMPKL